MNRGEVYWADIMPRSGSEQSGRRPVVIISNDIFNKPAHWHSITVIPISTSIAQAKRGPTVVFLPKGTVGLTQESLVVCHQITTLDKSKLSNYLGMLSDEFLDQIAQAIKIALDIE